MRPPIVQANDPDPVLMRASEAIDMTVVDGNYPLLLRAPCAAERLKALADRAHAQRERLVLVLPPRSPFATAHVGAATEAALRTEAQALATRLGSELFVPGGDWTNPEFVDAAHVNAAGRRHFLAALRSWWAAER